jgi:hypothetical protein
VAVVEGKYGAKTSTENQLFTAEHHAIDTNRVSL